MEVGHEEEADGSGGVKEEQETSREVKQQPAPVHHQQAGQLLGQHKPADTGVAVTPYPPENPGEAAVPTTVLIFLERGFC